MNSLSINNCQISQAQLLVRSLALLLLLAINVSYAGIDISLISVVPPVLAEGQVTEVKYQVTNNSHYSVFLPDIEILDPATPMKLIDAPAADKLIESGQTVELRFEISGPVNNARFIIYDSAISGALSAPLTIAAATAAAEPAVEAPPEPPAPPGPPAAPEPAAVESALELTPGTGNLSKAPELFFSKEAAGIGIGIGTGIGCLIGPLIPLESKPEAPKLAKALIAITKAVALSAIVISLGYGLPSLYHSH